MIAVVLFASQSFSQTARDYYNELYKAGGLDRMADRYVCFTDDPKQENFFIFGESKDIRESMMADGKFAKMQKAFQDQFRKDWVNASLQQGSSVRARIPRQERRIVGK
jgi:hypothetical protein